MNIMIDGLAVLGAISLLGSTMFGIAACLLACKDDGDWKDSR
jgi:hypothetical protein